MSNFTIFFHSQLDVHFDNQVLRLASVNCEAEILLKIVLQKKIDLASATAAVDISQKPTKIARIGESHQYFACILRNHGDEGKKTYFSTKGHLISKYLFGVFNSSIKRTKTIRPEVS